MVYQMREDQGYLRPSWKEFGNPQHTLQTIPADTYPRQQILRLKFLLLGLWQWLQLL